MTLNEIRTKFIEYYKKNEHVEIGSSSLIPKNDPTTLFTGSGMQPLLPYLLGKEHPKGKKLVNSQKCFRADDIEEIGDNRHTTCFEMLGNWSLGQYFKEEQLPWFFKFVTEELGLDPNRLYASAFIGDVDNNIPRDEESVTIWQRLFAEKGIEAQAVEIGSEANGAKVGMQGGRIFYYDSKKNWWSRAGVPSNMPAGEPGGPDSELFYEFTEIKHDPAFGEHCHPNCDCGRFLEIGNSVFMEYIKNEDGTFSPLPQKNVDFGGGLERLTAVTEGHSDIYRIDVYEKIITSIEKKINRKYLDADELTTRAFRILVDHIKGATFIMADGIKPSNLGQGYIVRRLIRRAIRYAQLSGIFEQKLCSLIAESVVNYYSEQYPELGNASQTIYSELDIEEAKFLKTIEAGLREFDRLTIEKNSLSGKEVFDLFASHGLPMELTREIAEERGITIDEAGFRVEFEKHQEISRAGIQEKKFASGLENKEDPQIIKYHTVAHLLLAALREVLGEHVHQKGSNITAERVRFDFSQPAKLTDEEKKAVEDWVNDKIAKELPVFVCEVSPEEAKKAGAEGEFSHVYGDKVTVYSIGGEIDSKTAVSKEICTGPHVENTAKLGTFKIKKEESSSSGVRRIKAVLL